jgi:thiosulfate/3-mercaptopyruvate sulfurtransferase
MAKNITLCQFRQHNGVVIDTRDSALYNGWPDALYGTSGHLPVRVTLPHAGWTR